MTETQATSEAAEASTKSVDEEPVEGDAPATGRAAVGRAVVPADSPSPKFTRAPGMKPPPNDAASDENDSDGQPSAESETAPKSGASAGPSASAKVAPAAPSRAAQATPAAPAKPAGGGRPEAGAKAEGSGGNKGKSAVPSRPTGPAAGGQDRTGRSGGQDRGPDRPERSGGQDRPGRAGGGQDRNGRPGGPDRTERLSAPGFGGGRPGTATAPGPTPASPGGAAGAVRNLGANATAVGAARVSDAVRAARSAVSSAAARGPRRARLNVKRIDPWSVMKFAFAVSLVLFIVVIVATSVLYLALDAMGVFQSVNDSLTDLVSASGGENNTGFKITAKGVIGTSALVGLVNVVLFTALATLAAFIYNVCADLVGGIEVTLAERD